LISGDISGESLFGDDYDFVDPDPSAPECNTDELPEPLKTQLATVCGDPLIVDPSLADECAYDVCTSGDITAAGLFVLLNVTKIL
jgi:hypothetical protein